jgi:hypothetical protein
MIVILLSILTGILATLATYFLHNNCHRGAVFSSAFSSLLFAILMFFLSSFLGRELSNQLSLIFFGGSFVGMSHKKIMQHNVVNLLLSGSFFSIVFLLTKSSFVGHGGGLGLRALIAVLFVSGGSWLWKKLANRLK